jgi:xanthine dehydrogenase accessory factor
VSTLPPKTFVVIMTQGHATDLPILKRALEGEFTYVGNMGSEVKAKALKRDLLEAGLASEKMDKMFCPIGEPIGNNSPEEIAISIAAQLLRIRGN